MGWHSRRAFSTRRTQRSAETTERPAPGGASGPGCRAGQVSALPLYSATESSRVSLPTVISPWPRPRFRTLCRRLRPGDRTLRSGDLGPGVWGGVIVMHHPCHRWRRIRGLVRRGFCRDILFFSHSGLSAFPSNIIEKHINIANAAHNLHYSLIVILWINLIVNRSSVCCFSALRAESVNCG